MDVIYERVAGLDVHKETVVATVRVMVGAKAERECRTFETTTAGLSVLLAWLTEARCSHVAMEATGVYWKPVWNILSDGAFELIVANAAHIKNVPGRKTDVNDATWIADLLACGLIRGSFVPNEKFQELRALQRTRKQLTREQTRHVQRLQKTLEEANIKLDSVISDLRAVVLGGHVLDQDAHRVSLDSHILVRIDAIGRPDEEPEHQRAQQGQEPDHGRDGVAGGAMRHLLRQDVLEGEPSHGAAEGDRRHAERERQRTHCAPWTVGISPSASRSSAILPGETKVYVKRDVNIIGEAGSSGEDRGLISLPHKRLVQIRGGDE